VYPGAWFSRRDRALDTKNGCGNNRKVMAAKRKIVILLHEKDRYPAAAGYFIWTLCEVWREWGIEIEAVKGTRKPVAADLLIPHIDATVLPRAYVDFFESHPRVVNRRLHDISKRLVSRNLLARTDSHDGQVIVKTNLNSGGSPDANLSGHKIVYSGKRGNFWSGWLNFRRKKKSSDWREINCMDSHDYQLFPSLAAVPEAVFANPSLVVERFLPEYENGVYYLRVYQFLGDCGYCARVGSRHPIVKQKNIISREEVPVPDEIIAIRRELGMDYGKLDFVVREGRVILLDVNRTPGRIRPIERMKANASRLAPGINGLF
jgi:hypothetical protein